MRFHMLGRFEIETEQGTTAVRSAPVRGLLAVLMLEEGRVVPASQLVESLWDRPPSSACNNLRLHVARLRRQLGAMSPLLKGRLVTLRGSGGAGYALRAESSELDVSEFRRLSRRGDSERRAGDHLVAERTLTAALDLWHGPVGQDCTASEELRSRLEMLGELRLSVLERLTDVRIALGHTMDLRSTINDVLRVAPFRETSWANLVRARYLAGDIDGAFRAWSQAAGILRSELGVEPSAAVFELQHAMLQRDDHAVRRSFACDQLPPVGAARPG
jgi:DNA-binding SARP family transcriptional activator